MGFNRIYWDMNEINGDWMGYSNGLLLKMAIEIVDLPIKTSDVPWL